MRDAARITQGEKTCTCIDDLVAEFYSAAYRLCLSILDDPDEAQDAVQETFIAACSQWAGFRRESSEKTWLFAIAINTCRQHIRKHGRRTRLIELLTRTQRVFGHTSQSEEIVSRIDQDQGIWTVVSRLEEIHRLPILLHYAHGLSIAEIAQVMGTNEGTIQSRLHYARKYLAAWLTREEYSTDNIPEVWG